MKFPKGQHKNKFESKRTTFRQKDDAMKINE